MAAAVYPIEKFRFTREARLTGQVGCYCKAMETGRERLQKEIGATRGAFPWAAIRNLDGDFWTQRRAADCDLVYSLEILGSLPEVAARQVLKAAFEYLKPGGRLLFANVCLGAKVGLCDTCIRQTRNYRNEFEMAALTRNIPDHAIQSQIVYRDAAGQNLFLEVQKYGAMRGPSCN